MLPHVPMKALAPATICVCTARLFCGVIHDRALTTVRSPVNA
jgi:hypothetical protein